VAIKSSASAKKPGLQLRESVMFKDRKFIWVVEYFIGLVLLAIIMPSILRPHPGWSEAHGWAYLLFIACSGIILISAAGAMKQRLKMAKRITELERTVCNLKAAQNQTQNEAGQKHATSGNLVGSVN
jgi:hypothetical protein